MAARLLLISISIGLLLLSVASSGFVALASGSVSFSIARGRLAVQITEAYLEPVAYDAAHDQIAHGALAIIIDNAESTPAGWRVSISSSPFVCSCGFPGSAIGAGRLRIDSLPPLTPLAGQPIHPTRGPAAAPASAGANLTTSRTVARALPSAGIGAYGQRIGLALTIPAGSRPATYVATITVTVSSAP